MEQNQELRFPFLGLCGGFGVGETGIRKAGADVILSVDNSVECEKIHQLNKQDRPFTSFYRADLLETDVEDLLPFLRRAMVDDGDLFGILSSPPCQNQSAANPNATFMHPMNALYLKCQELTAGLHPKFFLFEEVFGLPQLKEMQPLFTEIKLRFKELFPDYTLHARIINSIYFDNQRRRRFFVVGVRKDLGVDFKWPDPDIQGVSERTIGRLFPDIDGVLVQRLGKSKLLLPNNFFPTLTATECMKFVRSGVASKPTYEELAKIMGMERPFITGDLSYSAVHQGVGNGIPVNLAASIVGAIIKCYEEKYPNVI